MSSPAEQFCQTLLERAVIENASDIHLEPFEESFCVRLRTPTQLLSLPAPQKGLFSSLVRHIKLLSKIDIAVENLPQDGKFAMALGGGMVEFRVSCLPTVFGPSVVLRVLDRERTPLVLDALGFDGAIIKEIKRALALPFGLVIVTGATGSGKTTTLYACLRYLCEGRKRKIVSVEDPIEYALSGVQQVSVSDRVSFSSALRAFLRHDPDVIFVGEIRDSATARLAVQAALTGHLVLSSLHAGTSDQVVTRLNDLGVENYLISSSLKFTLLQSLHVNAQRQRIPSGTATWHKPTQTL